MSGIGLVSNPGSQRNRRGLSAIEAAARSAGWHHSVLGNMTELPGVLRHLSEHGVELLAVNGGDGTVQAVLTELLEARPFARLPRLALLPRGMTNMTAADVGLRGRPAQAIERLSARWRAGDLEGAVAARHILRLENVPGFRPQWGMFFGAASICRAIDYCHSRIHPWQIGADLASALTLSRLLLSWLLRGRESEVVAGERIAARFDNGPEETGEMVLALATTLDKLVLGSQPFWNQRGEPLHYTAIAYPPRRLLRSARQVLYGDNAPKLPAEGYQSRGAHRIELSFQGPFTLDGQMFEAPREAPLVITAPEAVEFLRL